MRKLQLIAFTIAALSITPAFALSNQECVEVYRDGYLDLRESIVAYNGKSLRAGDFAAEVTATDAAVKGLRAACFFTESPDVKECVDSYKDLYKDLRGRVRVRAVLAGNQESVSFSEHAGTTDRNEGGIRGFFRDLRSGGADAAKLGRLAIIDAKCK